MKNISVSHTATEVIFQNAIQRDITTARRTTLLQIHGMNATSLAPN